MDKKNMTQKEKQASEKTFTIYAVVDCRWEIKAKNKKEALREVKFLVPNDWQEVPDVTCYDIQED